MILLDNKSFININKICDYLINNNYILKKSNINFERQLLYFINKDNFSQVIKINIDNLKKKINSKKINIQLTIPLKRCNYEYTTQFNNLNSFWEYLKYHINYLN
jgi:hypothetical protein